ADLGAMAQYLALQYLVAPRPILTGVHKLPPAHQLVFDAASGRTVISRYWDLVVDGSLRISEEDAAHELERLLDAAVGKRLVADVPLGIFLSGGVDSSTVAAVAAAQRRGIRTFSVRFSDPSYDESAHAR